MGVTPRRLFLVASVAARSPNLSWPQAVVCSCASTQTTPSRGRDSKRPTPQVRPASGQHTAFMLLAPEALLILVSKPGSGFRKAR
jgi:hypothetical protein